MLNHLRPAIALTVFFTHLSGLAYPLAITGVAQALTPTAANGSLLMRDGKVVGSTLIGQSFAGAAICTPAPVPRAGTRRVPGPPTLAPHRWR